MTSEYDEWKAAREKFIDSLAGVYDGTVTNLNSEYKTLKREIEEKSKVAFQKAMKLFFERHPDVIGIVWTQYTPYFMDGDACEFGVNDPEVMTKETLAKLEIDTIWQVNSPYDIEEIGPYVSFDTNFGATDELRHLFGCLPDNAFEFMFGDHAMVIMDREKAEVEEHHHD